MTSSARERIEGGRAKTERARLRRLLDQLAAASRPISHVRMVRAALSLRRPHSGEGDTTRLEVDRRLRCRMGVCCGPRPSPLPPRQTELRPDHDHRGRGDLDARAASAEFGGRYLIISSHEGGWVNRNSAADAHFAITA